MHLIQYTFENTIYIYTFLSGGPTYHSFYFSSRSLSELKHKGRLSKNVCRIFLFVSHFVVIKVYVFVQQNATLWFQNVMIPLKFKIIEKPHTILLPYL